MDIYSINKWLILAGVLALFALFGAGGYCIYTVDQSLESWGDSALLTPEWTGGTQAPPPLLLPTPTD